MMRYIPNLLRKIVKLKKLTYNHIDQIWSIDLADMIDYKTSNSKRFRYNIIMIDIL